MVDLVGLKECIYSKEVDFGRQSQAYSTYRPGLPSSFYDRISRYIALEDKQVLDLGTGPATIAIDLAKRGAKVVGIDISPQQIAQAIQVVTKRNLQHLCSFQVATAEDTQLPNCSFDVVTAGQCWPWFDHSKAMPEIHRVLKPDGFLIVAQYCFLPQLSPLVYDTEQLILKYNPSWPMSNFSGLYPSQVSQLTFQGGFHLVEQFCYDYGQPYTHESWLGRMKTCSGVGSGILTEMQLVEWENELKDLLQKKYPEESFTVPYRAWCVIVQTKEKK